MRFSYWPRIVKKLNSYWVTQQLVFMCYIVIFSIFCYPLLISSRRFLWCSRQSWHFLLFSSSERFLYRPWPYWRFLLFSSSQRFSCLSWAFFEAFLCFSDNIKLTFLYICEKKYIKKCFIRFVINSKPLKTTWNHFNYPNQESSQSALYRSCKLHEYLMNYVKFPTITWNYLNIIFL